MSDSTYNPQSISSSQDNADYAGGNDLGLVGGRGCSGAMSNIDARGEDMAAERSERDGKISKRQYFTLCLSAPNPR